MASARNAGDSESLHHVLSLAATVANLRGEYEKANEYLEEERRLFYVAITRAKQNLYLTCPVNVFDRTSGMVLSKPSRFLDEVRRDCLESWSLIDEDDFHG